MTGQSVQRWWRGRGERRDGKAVLLEGRRVLRRYRHRLTASQRAELTQRIEALAQALAAHGDVAATASTLSALLDGDELAFARKSTLRQYVESVGGVVFVALMLRSFVVEAYEIPSGSMLPTLQIGDHLWVNKLIYGVRIPFTDIKLATHYRMPRRGEVIVFADPKGEERDLIKRVIGVPGDVVEMNDNVVYINARPVARLHQGRWHYFDYSEESATWHDGDADAWQETLGAATYTTLHDTAARMRYYGPTTVPADSLFVMGDNRDNSNDSRYWGFVPLNLVRGQAMFVWWSYGQPEGVRLGRFGHIIH